MRETEPLRRDDIQFTLAAVRLTTICVITCFALSLPLSLFLPLLSCQFIMWTRKFARMRDRLSWYMVFLILPTILLARSLDKDRRVPFNIPSDWKALWYSNLDELQRVNEANENNTVSNVTVQLGGTAFLHCKVRNLAERSVSDAEISWIRRRDWHVLTSSMFTYTNDERFQVLHPEGSDDWTLQIKYVQERDNGTYECQVSRSTGILSHFVNLNIVTPEAFILGGEEHHVDVGSIISLVCIIEKSPTPPQYVFWYHNNRMINYDTARGSVTVQTDPGPTQSRLTIRHAVESDTGNYTCSASNTKPASIFVFVTEGDKMAAILRRKTSSGSRLKLGCTLILLLQTLLLALGSGLR